MRKTGLRHTAAFLADNRISVFWMLALCCFFLSFLHLTPVSSIKRTDRIERMLHKRENVLDKYVERAFEVPENEWIQFEEFPEDMVLYRYIGGVLQSWINTFPISNDDIGISMSWYRIHDLRNRNLFNIPLAFLDAPTQYVNLGPAWYIVKVFRRGDIEIIGAIEVMQQYSSENAVLHNSCNRRLGLNDRYTTAPPYVDDVNVVYTADGTPAFSVLRNTTLTDRNHQSAGMRWAALLFAIFAILSFQSRYKGLRQLYFALGGLLLLQCCSFMMVGDIDIESELFSPMLYADGNFNSLGALLIFHSFVFLYCLTVFMSRKSVIKSIRNSARVFRRAKTTVIGLSIIAVAVYIHTTFRSLTINSGINLDLFRINDISFYTIVIYLAYGMLFLAGFTATNKLYGLLEIAATSYGFAVTSYVGQNLGARLVNRIKRGQRAAAVVAFLTSVVIAAAMLLFGRLVLGLFISGEPAEVEASLDIAYHYLSIMSVCLPILYMLHIYRSALMGLGDTVVPMLSGFAEMVVRIGVALLLPLVMGQEGIYYAEVGAWTAAAILLVAAYYARMRALSRRKGFALDEKN